MPQTQGSSQKRSSLSADVAGIFTCTISHLLVAQYLRSANLMLFKGTF